jgi:hypothetical protein
MRKAGREKPLLFLEGLARDLRQAARQAARRPGFT